MWGMFDNWIIFLIPKPYQLQSLSAKNKSNYTEGSNKSNNHVDLIKRFKVGYQLEINDSKPSAPLLAVMVIEVSY